MTLNLSVEFGSSLDVFSSFGCQYNYSKFYVLLFCFIVEITGVVKGSFGIV